MSMGTSLRSYYRGHTLVSMRDGQANASRYYHFDAQGTTQCLTNEAGAVTDRFAADAWGVQVKRTGSSINRHWFLADGGYVQDAPQLNYIRARHRATRANWLSRDPIRQLSRSRYAYADNSPALLWDPTGLEACADDSCCCCVDSISLANVRDVSYTDIFPQSLWAQIRRALRDLGITDIISGYHFDANIGISTPKAKEPSPCKLEWWECDSHPTKDSGGKAEHWWLRTGDLLSREQGDAWTKFEKEYEKKSCLNSRNVTIYDRPSTARYNLREGTLVSRSRNLWIFIRVRSGVCDPPCANKDKVLGLQFITVISQGKVLEKSLKKVTLPEPESDKKCR